jgi:hypothetical protein
MADGEIVTKGRFAEISGVSPGRVSQWISEGKIPPSAMVGEGRSARIRVDEARASLDRSLDLTQRLGLNGKARVADVQAVPVASFPSGPGLDEQIRMEVLEQRKIDTRRMMREEALSAGTLVQARDVSLATDKIVGRMLTAVDQAIVEMATAVVEMVTEAQLAAAGTETAGPAPLARRDVEMVLRRIWREQRTRQAPTFAAEAAAAEPETEVEIDLQ